MGNSGHLKKGNSLFGEVMLKINSFIIFDEIKQKPLVYSKTIRPILLKNILEVTRNFRIT